MALPFALPTIGANLLWKLGGSLAVIATVVLTILLMASYKETGDITRQRNELSMQINDPKTGYVAQLSQARTNTAQLRSGFERQIIVAREREAQNLADLNRTREQLRLATLERQRLEKRARAIMATPPEGDNLEQRVTDVDNRIMEDLNRDQ